MTQVIEFVDIASMNEWMKEAEDRGSVIKKVFRSPDKVYFIWYEEPE